MAAERPSNGCATSIAYAGHAPHFGATEAVAATGATSQVARRWKSIASSSRGCEKRVGRSNHSFVHTIVLILLAFSLKMLAVAGAGRIVRRRWSIDALPSWLIGWLLVHSATVAVFLAASFASAVTAQLVWVWLVVGALAYPLSGLGRLRAPRLPDLAVLPIFAVFALMMFRSLVYLDNTLDAQTYGLVRLGIWMNYQSILVIMPTLQVNVFANEWNGELIGLLYGIAAGSIQGFQFGCVEQLIVLFVSALWLLRGLGAGKSWSILAATAIATTPAVLGLASVVKGDLLACAALVMAAGGLFELRRHPVAASMIVTASLALAVGSKVTAAVGVAAIAGIALYLVVREGMVRRAAAGVLLGAPIAFVTLSRFVVNFIEYGTPLKRVEAEKIAPGLETLWTSLDYIARMTVTFGPERAAILGWSLAGGAGLVVSFSAVAFALRKREQETSHLRTFLIVLSVGATVATAYFVPTYPWSYRYFLPMILVVVACLLASVAARWRPKMMAAAIVIIAIDASYMLWPGEINGNNTFAGMVQVGLTHSPLDISVPEYMKAEYHFAELNLDRSRPRSFGVLAEVNRPVSPLVGSRAQNRLYLASNTSELADTLKRHCPNFAVITKPFGGALLSRDQTAPIAVAGYKFMFEGEIVAIARKTNCRR